MCGRYYADDDTEREAIRLTKDQKVRMKKGDIHPSEEATVLSYKGGDAAAENMIWGFPGFEGRSLLINARAETVTDRRAFRESVLYRRCVIPAKGFYEWSPQKEKYQFEDEKKVLFMAGCFDEENRFVIITTAANDSVQPVHERMPLLLSEEEIFLWMGKRECMEGLLKKVPQELCRRADYNQMSLFGEDQII